MYYCICNSKEKTSQSLTSLLHKYFYDDVAFENYVLQLCILEIKSFVLIHDNPLYLSILHH